MDILDRLSCTRRGMLRCGREGRGVLVVGSTDADVGLGV
jgi:hypothetical protein